MARLVAARVADPAQALSLRQVALGADRRRHQQYVGPARVAQYPFVAYLDNRVSVKEPGLSGAVRHLFSPRYEEKLAVDAIDLNVEAGESIAYVGPNGAGESTTVKMLSGILVPTSGELQVMGLVPHRNRIENARNIGVVFGQRTHLWWDLPVQESLRLLGDIYQVPEKMLERNLKTFDDLLQLGPLLPVPARHLSLAQRMSRRQVDVLAQ
jgi:ABC-2 type transport system ATP-binding protein